MADDFPSEADLFGDADGINEDDEAMEQIFGHDNSSEASEAIAPPQNTLSRSLYVNSGLPTRARLSAMRQSESTAPSEASEVGSVDYDRLYDQQLGVPPSPMGRGRGRGRGRPAHRSMPPPSSNPYASIHVSCMPDYDSSILGDGINARPPVFGQSRDTVSGWVDFGALEVEEPMVPVRAMCLNMPVSVLANDASRMYQWQTTSENPTRTTNIACLLGLLYSTARPA